MRALRTIGEPERSRHSLDRHVVVRRSDPSAREHDVVRARELAHLARDDFDVVEDHDDAPTASLRARAASSRAPTTFSSCTLPLRELVAHDERRRGGRSSAPASPAIELGLEGSRHRLAVGVDAEELLDAPLGAVEPRCETRARPIPSSKSRSEASSGKITALELLDDVPETTDGVFERDAVLGAPSPSPGGVTSSTLFDFGHGRERRTRPRKMQGGTTQSPDDTPGTTSAPSGSLTTGSERPDASTKRTDAGVDRIGAGRGRLGERDPGDVTRRDLGPDATFAESFEG